MLDDDAFAQRQAGAGEASQLTTEIGLFSVLGEI
jgi:hypothetical protein